MRGITSPILVQFLSIFKVSQGGQQIFVQFRLPNAILGCSVRRSPTSVFSGLSSDAVASLLRLNFVAAPFKESLHLEAIRSLD